MSIHIYTTDYQPATRVRIDLGRGRRPLILKCGPHKLIYTDCCHRKRQAKNLTAQAYYDCVKHWCRAGKGCKRERQ